MFASCQAWGLGGRLSRVWPWILCGPAGFAAIILVIWPFTAIWGEIPGPVEPFTIVGGGLLATGFLQWLFLRRRGVDATRWLMLWLVGLPIGIVVFMLAYTLLDTVVALGEQYSIGWAGGHLDRAGHTLALVEMRWSGVDAPVDLCDPASLVALAVAPDRIASRHRAVTQPIAHSIWAQGARGRRLRSGAWRGLHHAARPRSPSSRARSGRSSPRRT